MPFSIYDKIPKSPLPSSPFEFIAKLAEGQKQDLDELDARIGETKGLFAKLVPAKGHELYAERVSNTWNQQLTDLMDKHANNPLSREFSRDLTSLAASFANDGAVQKIVESKNFYDKFGPTLFQELSKGSKLNAKGILDENKQFIPNEELYSFDKFKLVPHAEYMTPIRQIINIKKEQKLQSEDAVIEDYDDKGNPIYETTSIQRIWNDPKNRADVSKAIFDEVINYNTSDPGLRFLHAEAEEKFPNDLAAQHAYIKEGIRLAGVPFDYDWTLTDVSITKGSGGSGGGTKKADDADKMIGGAITVGKDYIVGADGKTRILSAGALSSEAKSFNDQYEQLILPKNLATVSPTLFEADGQTLRPDAFVTTSDGYRLVNTELITDKFEQNNARDLNMKLTSLQLQEGSLYQLQANFMGKAGFDYNKPLLDQVDGTALKDASDEALSAAFYKAASLSGITPVLPMTEEAFTTHGFWGKSENWENKNGAMVLSEAAIKQGFKEIIGSQYGFKNPEDLEAWATKLMGVYEDTRMQELLNSGKDQKLVKYKDLTEAYLNSTVYTKAFTYSVVDAEDKRRILDIIAPIVKQRDVQRANFGPEAGGKSQTLGDDDKDKLIEQFDKKEVKDASSIGVRYDTSRAEWVVDLGMNGESYEIGGLAQQGLAAIAQQQDPELSNQYLQKTSSLLSQLDATNGRYATVDMPIRDNNNVLVSNDRLVVKTAIQAYGADAAMGDYLFAFPEVPDRVFVAKNDWAIINMTDAYREMKQSGKYSEADIKDKLAVLMDTYSVTSIPYRQKNIGPFYFPTPESRISSVKADVGKVTGSGSSSGIPGPNNTPRNNTSGGTGNTTRKKGQTLADYNMNPGNLRFANQTGAVNENGWAKFNSPEDGIAALENQIMRDAKRGDNIRTFIEDYAPSIENDTEAYIRHMASTLGVSEDTSLTDIISSQGIRAVAKAIAMKEDGNYYNTIKDLF